MTELSSASILRITDTKTLQLIDLYYKEECLWNSKIEDYKNREKRAHATEKIATILDLPNFTAKHVLMKFKNLRNSYSQEQKKIAHSIESGATGDDVYVPKVFWYSKLDSFIRPHIHGKGPKEQALIFESQIYRLDDSTDEWIQVGQAEHPLNPDSSMPEHRSLSDDEHPSMSHNGPKKRKLPIYPAKRTRAEIAEEKSVSQSLKDIQSHLRVLMSHKDDYHDTFGKYVASLLRSLPPQKALALQPKIVSLITESGLDNEEQSETAECQSSNDIIVQIDRDDSD